jgi:putative hydrolase of the HAD superfamily
MLPKGILFDLDDTIVAFGAASIPAWKGVCEEFYRRCGLLAPGSLFDAIDETRRWYWSDKARHKTGRLNLDRARREIVGLAFEKIELDSPSLVDQIADAYSARREEMVAFFPGAEETLEYLAAHNLALALITNGEAQKQRARVRRFRLDRFFKTILIEGELGYGKPEETVYRRALAALGLGPEEVWSVGDNLEWDVSAPQKLGIFGIWNDHRGQGLPPSSKVIPDRIINSISELMV